MKISLAVTTYNRYEMTINSFSQVLNDDRINDVIILDDCSTDGSYEKIRNYFIDHPKVTVRQQIINRGMSVNKRDAVSYAQMPFVIIWDSDNTLTPEYLNALEWVESVEGFNDTTFYMPSFAMPKFSFKEFEGKTYDIFNVDELINIGMGEVCMNTSNMLVPRDGYVAVHVTNDKIKGVDTLWQNIQWLKAGNNFYIVPNLEYFHLVHKKSTFMEHCDYNMLWAKKLKNEILELNAQYKKTENNF